jgi:hypothetical protein
MSRTTGQKVESAGGKNSDVDEIGPLLQTSICLHEAGVCPHTLGAPY